MKLMLFNVILNRTISILIKITPCLTNVLFFLFFLLLLYLDPKKILESKFTCVHFGSLFIISILLINLPQKCIRSNVIINTLLFFLTPLYVIVMISSQPTGILDYQIFAYLSILTSQALVTLFIPIVRYSVCINAFMYSLLILTNNIVTSLRGGIFLPADFFTYPLALKIFPSYIPTLKINYTFLSPIIAFIVFCLFCKKLYNKQELAETTNFYKNKFKQKLVVQILCSIVVLGYSKNYTKFIPNGYLDGIYENAFVSVNKPYISSFILELINYHVEKPDGYNEYLERNKFQNYHSSKLASFKLNQNTSSDTSPKKHPDIIVIVDESFFDITQFKNLNLSQDPLPTFHNIQQNYLSGSSYASVFGGSTANTEWELFTSSSMVFNPHKVPFNQVIFSKTNSLVHHLKKYGYTTIAWHPFLKYRYRADLVYPYLGFDKYLSLHDKSFINSDPQHPVKLLRDFISDETSFEKIIEIYKKHKATSSDPVFIYNLTMQNHSYYEKMPDSELNFKINAPQLSPNVNHSVTEYVELLSHTDRAIKILIDYFSNIQDPTIILFLGDHLPNLGTEFYSAMFGYSPFAHQCDHLEICIPYWNGQDRTTLFKVPYFIWTSFPYDQNSMTEYKELSMNYLSLPLLQIAGIPFSNYYEFIYDMHEEYPVFSVGGIKSKNLGWTKYRRNSVRFSDRVLNYKKLQYYTMFDKKDNF